MQREVVVRRVVHLSIALAPLYFLVPDDLPLVGLRRWVLLILFFAGIAVFEVLRLRLGMTFLGLRPHETHQIASFAWAAAGITFVLWIFPHDIAIAAQGGCAVVDPLAGELRSARKSKEVVIMVSLGVYTLLALTVYLVADWRLAHALALALSGSVVGVLAELDKNPYIDDDFLMAVTPAVVTGFLALLISGDPVQGL